MMKNFSALLLCALAVACGASPQGPASTMLAPRRTLLAQQGSSGVFDSLKSMLKELAKGFEKDVSKVEHALAEIPADLESELDKLEKFISKIDNQADLKAAVKAIGNFILKFQPWLVKVNSKVFGPELGPVLEKLELAAVEQVPVVGIVFKVLVEGVDIYNDIKGMSSCIKTKDYLCAGKDLLALFTAVSDIMLADFSSMKKIITGLSEVEKALGGGIDVAETISRDIPKLKDCFTLLEKPTVDNVIAAVSDLGDICVDVVTEVENVDPAVIAKWKTVADRFKKEIMVAEDIHAVWVAGKDIYPLLQSAKKCWEGKDYECVGQDVGKIISEVEAVVEEHFKTVNGLTQALAKAGDAVNCAVDVEETYKDLDSMVNYLKDPTPANVEEAIGQFAAACTELATGVGTVNGDLSPKLKAFADKLTKDLKVVADDAGKAKQVLVSGMDIYSSVQAAKKCWDSKDYTCLAAQIQKMIADVEAAAGQFQSMKAVCQALAKVSSAVGISTDVVATYGVLSSAFAALEAKPLTAADVQDALRSVSTAMDQIISEVTQLNGVVGRQMFTVAKKIEADAAEVKVVAGDAAVVVQSGADIVSQLKSARQCWARKDFACIGKDLNSIVTDVEAAVAALPHVQKLSNIVSEVGTDVKLAGAFLQTYQLFVDGLKSIEAGSETSVKAGLKDLSDGFTQIQSELSDLDSDTKSKYTKIITKLAGDVTVTTSLFGKVEKIAFGSYEAKDDLMAAAQCAQASPANWDCVAQNLKKVVAALESMKTSDSQLLDMTDGWTTISVSTQLTA